MRRRRGRGARERILKAATELFVAQGINATGMDQLSTVAEVSTRTLYVHFPSKDKLVQAYLQALGERLLPPASPVHAASDAREQLLAIFDRRSQDTTAPLRGRPFLNASAEVPDPGHPSRQLAAAHKREYARRLTDIAPQAGVSAPETLGQQLALLFDGAVARSVALNSSRPQESARSIADYWLTPPSPMSVYAHRDEIAALRDTSRTQPDGLGEPTVEQTAVTFEARTGHGWRSPLPRHRAAHRHPTAARRVRPRTVGR
ncbi:TetR/AcrR family transcriptional regulator [Streptomyces chartreusis]|uniref:TetR/AcrR family transcriptional regulator n=1 Tax=Streptomyces chartreusis TaxID=1969 RepID=UPI0036396D10